MAFHHKQTGLDIHALTANPSVYANIAARDADSAFHSDVANVDKLVRVESPLSFYLLGSAAPVWVELSNLGSDEFIDHIDTPASYAGAAGQVLQVNGAGGAVEFGQKLRTTDSPLFASLDVDNLRLDGNVLSSLNTDGDIILTPNGLGSVVVSKDLTVSGNLTVQGTTTFLDTETLQIEDKNIELGKVAVPTDLTADGGGITLKATVDITILWINATNSWTFNQSIDLLGNNLISTGSVVGGRILVDNLQLDGNELSSTFGDLDVTTATGGVFKFTFNAFQAGQDVANYLEIGHAGSNAFLNAVGAGGMDFRFDGVTKATFTDFGHLHLLTDVDQKHTLKIVTANNLNDTGIAWENSGGSFTHTIFRTDVGANRADLVFAAGQNVDIDLLINSFKIHGGAGVEGKLEIIGALQISSGVPALDRVLTSDVNGNATWQVLPVSIGWVGGGGVVNLNVSTDKVAIGGFAPDSKLHVTDGADGAAGAVTAFVGTIATFESPGNGFLSILTPDASVRGILFGQPSSNVAGGIFYNDPGSPDGFQFRVNGNSTKMVIERDGAVGIGTPNPDVTSILDLSSTTKGFLSPRMTTAQRDAISSPLAGLEIYNTTVDKAEIFTGAIWETVLTEGLGNVIAQETFASTNVRFFGELALPATQGWIDTATGPATIDLFADTVFGEPKQVVRHNDDVTTGSTTSKITLTAQNWTDINDFGASYSGTSRLDTTDGAGGFFAGLQANAAENPLATGNRRYGLLFADDAGNLKVTDVVSGGATVTFDGTGGNPLIAFDEWFSWECVVPAGLGSAQFYINKILTTFAPTFGANTGGLGTQIIVSSGSTAGANRVTYHDNFGVTIFEESATKTLSATTMSADVAQVNIPEGKRDYTVILPDGNARPIGAVLRLVVSNLLGTVTLTNQDVAIPEILYNGLRTEIIDVFVKEIIEGINTVNSGNVYIGFKDEDIDRAESIFAQLSSSVDQIPSTTNPQVITYNTQDEINGIGHSTSLNSGELEILPGFGGVYFVSPQAQVGKDTGGVKVDFDMFWEIDRGGGFVDEANSNIKLTIKDADITDVIVSAFTIELAVGDKIRMLQRVSSSIVGMGLKNTDPEVGPPTVPRTPSIILTVHRVGGSP